MHDGTSDNIHSTSAGLRACLITRFTAKIIGQNVFQNLYEKRQLKLIIFKTTLANFTFYS